MRTPVGLSRTFSSLSVYNYRLYWLGQMFSLTGTWMQTIGQSWLVLKLTGSASALGTVTMLQFLPITLFTLFGGVLADRFPKRKLLFVTQTIAALQALILGLLVLTNTIQLWQLYVLALVLGLVNAFDNPTRQAFVVEMVGRERLPNAVALNSTLFNTARLAGPALGGALITVFGIAGAFLINAASFLATIVAMALMRPEEFHSVPKSVKGRMLSQVAEGVRYSLSTPEVLLIIALMGTLGTFGYNFTVLLPLIARFVLNTGALGLGILTAAMGAGSLLAALWVAYRRKVSRRMLLGGAGAFSVLLMLVGFSGNYVLTVGLLVLLGIASIIFSSTANTALQMIVPNELRGRVMSLYFLMFAGSTPIGAIITGTLASAIGVPHTIVLVASVCMIGVLAAALYARSRLRQPLEGTPASAPAVGERPETPAETAGRPVQLRG